MHLAAIQLQDLLVVVVFIVVPLAQKVFQHLQKKRVEAEAKERLRQRREGTVSMSSPASSATSTTDEPQTRGGLFERLEALVGEAQSESAPAERSTQVPDFDAETFWSDLQPEPAAEAEPEAAPRRVAPATETRQPVAQISDFESTSREGLGAMSAAPSEDDAEAGRFDYGVLATIEGLDSDGDSLQPLVDLPELGAAASGAAAPRAAAPGGRRARAVGFRGEQNWRRAIVLSEVIGPPISQRAPGGFAPGLAPWTS